MQDIGHSLNSSQDEALGAFLPLGDIPWKSLAADSERDHITQTCQVMHGSTGGLPRRRRALLAGSVLFFSLVFRGMFLFLPGLAFSGEVPFCRHHLKGMAGAAASVTPSGLHLLLSSTYTLLCAPPFTSGAPRPREKPCHSFCYFFFDVFFIWCLHILFLFLFFELPGWALVLSGLRAN